MCQQGCFPFGDSSVESTALLFPAYTGCPHYLVHAHHRVALFPSAFIITSLFSAF